MASQQAWESIAAKLFAKFGGQIADVTYKRSNPTSYNPVPGATAGASGSQTVDMFIKTKRDTFGAPPSHDLEGLARGSVFRALGIAEPLSTNDKITYGGRDHAITKIERIPETDAPILYRFTFAAAGR